MVCNLFIKQEETKVFIGPAVYRDWQQLLEVFLIDVQPVVALYMEEKETTQQEEQEQDKALVDS